MIKNNNAQASLVAWLKANTAVLALHSNFPGEIREIDWQGEDFLYPNVRVSCDITGGQEGCYDDCFAIVSCFSEQKSSKESQTISGTIADELHNKVFTQNSIRFSAIRVRMMRAVQENGVWKADLQVNAKVK